MRLKPAPTEFELVELLLPQARALAPGVSDEQLTTALGSLARSMAAIAAVDLPDEAGPLLPRQ